MILKCISVPMTVLLFVLLAISGMYDWMTVLLFELLSEVASYEYLSPDERIMEVLVNGYMS